MDFTSRNSQQSQTPLQASQASTAPKHKDRGSDSGNKLLKFGAFSFLLAVVVLAAAAIALIGFGNDKKESKYVNKDKYQAVFLTNGQVYFGHIKAVNEQFVDLRNIYYLQQNQSSGSSSNAKNNSLTLIKLGCELHQPYDEMVIQSSQVTFWENIQDSGQVGKKIKELKTCTPSNSTTQSTGSTPSASSQSNSTTPSAASASNSSNR